MSDTGFGNIDLSQLAADLAPIYAKYGQTNDSPGANIPQTLPGTDGNGTIYSQVETEVGRVDNGDGTFTVTYRGSTDPNAPTYTRIEGTVTATTTVDPGVVTYEGSGAGRVQVTTYKDGRVVRVASPQGTDDKPSGATGVPGKDARATIKALLATYKLIDEDGTANGEFGNLADYIYKIIGSGEVNLNNPDAILYSIRKHPTYERRFSANKERVKNGFDELDPASYIALEDQYRATLSANGMPVSFYDSKDDFDAMISGDVSNSELQSRIQDGYRAVQDADPEVKRQMQELYGVSEGDLAAYFIDPNRMKPLLVAADYKRQAQAAKIAARGVELAGIQLAGGLAEDLARRGVTETQAQTGFTAIGKLGELKTQLGGEAALSQEQIVGQQFGTDTQAALELEKRRRRRVGEFAGGGSFARTQGETSGSITTSIGKAQ